MNEHLKPVFEIILPALEQAGVEYSVFGGIGVAGMRQVFYRQNDDVDVCVSEKNFLAVGKILSSLARQQNWELKKDLRLVPGRPKYELSFIGEKHNFFSVIPLFETPDGIEFKFYKNSLVFENDIWNRERQVIGNFSFYRFKNKYVKELCLAHVKHLGKRAFEPEYRKYLNDLEGISSKEELTKILANSSL
ncbi:MAG: hypothetical protein Q8N98_04310 [bacterium]|nr:hypothetical protein [bacterium]